MRRVQGDKLVERRGKYVLYRDGRVLIITRSKTIALHAQKIPRKKRGKYGEKMIP